MKILSVVSYNMEYCDDMKHVILKVEEGYDWKEIFSLVVLNKPIKDLDEIDLEYLNDLPNKLKEAVELLNEDLEIFSIVEVNDTMAYQKSYGNNSPNIISKGDFEINYD